MDPTVETPLFLPLPGWSTRGTHGVCRDRSIHKSCPSTKTTVFVKTGWSTNRVVLRVHPGVRVNYVCLFIGTFLP